ncbi:MAG: DUF4294 domain-containing protein [Bacteroidia bacterium]|nr:DUF4294 domain-containing protein [Bacteroidia bacterium]
MKRFTTVVFVACFFLQPVIAQEPDSIPKVVPGKIIDGDTVPLVVVKTAYVYPPHKFKRKRHRIRYSKLVFNVQKVYPFAKIAAIKLTEFQNVMDTITTKKGRKSFAKQAEDALQEEFGQEIRHLTFSQGKILIKLIYRETGNSSYELVREIRGKFTAFIWQTFAALFGYNLKTGYDPNGEDQAIEEIIKLIDEGYF